MSSRSAQVRALLRLYCARLPRFHCSSSAHCETVCGSRSQTVDFAARSLAMIEEPEPGTYFQAPVRQWSTWELKHKSLRKPQFVMYACVWTSAYRMLPFVGCGSIFQTNLKRGCLYVIVHCICGVYSVCHMYSVCTVGYSACLPLIIQYAFMETA